MIHPDIIITRKEEIKQILKTAIKEVEKENEANKPDKLYTINQVAKKLGRAHETISKLVRRGVIRTTKDGLIPETSINEYLGQ